MPYWLFTAHIFRAVPAEQTFKKINSQQKLALRIIFKKNKFPHTREIFKEPASCNFLAHNFLVPTLKLKKSKYRINLNKRIKDLI